MSDLAASSTRQHVVPVTMTSDATHSLLRELDRLPFVRLELAMRATTQIRLPPHSGSTLRGGFGTALKQSVCTVSGGECARCLLRGACAYPYLFETPIPPETRRLASAPAAPRPFVLRLADPAQSELRVGDGFSIDLTLFGAAVWRLPYVVHAFAHLGRTNGIGRGSGAGSGGRFEIESVVQRRADGAIPLLDRTRVTLTEPRVESVLNRLSTPSSPLRAVQIAFRSPTRLVFDDDQECEPEFHILIRNALRRISYLTYFHAGYEPDLPFRELVDASRRVEAVNQSTRWVRWSRFSTRQAQRIPMAGLVGSVVYVGELERFWPLLVLAQVTHVGKQVAFGLGQIEVEAFPWQRVGAGTTDSPGALA